MGPLDATDVLDSGAPPWWAQPRYAIGVLAAIVGILLWFLIAVVDAGQREIATTLQLHVTGADAGVNRQLRMLEQICLNTSETDRDRAQCQAVTR